MGYASASAAAIAALIASLAVGSVGSLAQSATTDVPPQLSFECRVKSPVFEGKSPLRIVRRAIREKKPIRVLAIGSSSTVGVGASSPHASYPVRLENDLEGMLKGLDVEVINRGVSGEVAEGAADRMKLEVAEHRPHLVAWEVGTNDAMARIDLQRFEAEVRDTLRWLAESRIDVVLIDPQFVDRLAQDEDYRGIVQAIARLADEEHVLLVNRFDTMADLAKAKGNGAFLARDQFHLNDLGYKCMAEYAARAIVAGIIQAETEKDTSPRPN